MKKVILTFTALCLMWSCSDREPKFLSAEQIKQEKQDIIAVNEAYNNASEREDFAAIVETLSDEVNFFGTDSAEVIKSFSDFKEKMITQWETYDSIEYGDMQDVSIKMDPNGNLASIIFGVPLTVSRNEVVNSYYLRVSRTLEKKGENWLISQGIVGIARTPQQKKKDYELLNNNKNNDTEE